MEKYITFSYLMVGQRLNYYENKMQMFFDF